MSSACDALAELRSGFVDGALSPEDRERVVTHLLDCSACRADVAELRAVRDSVLAVAAQGLPAIDAGEVVEGSSTAIRRQRDVWTFSHTMGSSDPNWILVATSE